MGSHFDAVSKLIPKLVHEHVQQLLLNFKSNRPDTSEEDVKVEQRRLEVEVYCGHQNGILWLHNRMLKSNHTMIVLQAHRNLAAFKSIVEQVNSEIPHAGQKRDRNRIFEIPKCIFLKQHISIHILLAR